MDYKTVYDITNETFMQTIWMMNGESLLLVAVGFGVFWINLKYNKSTLRKRIYGMIFGLAFVLFPILMGLASAPAIWKDCQETKKLYENSEYKVVEGIVENFDPMPFGGHKNESFRVMGVKFEYTDFDVAYFGFNNTSSHGGPINRNGQKVRISYITKESRITEGYINVILKLEIKG